MASKIFVRERRKVEEGEKKPRFRILGVSGGDLKIYVKHIRKRELDQLAEAVGAEVPGWVEGTSLLPLIVGEGSTFERRAAAAYMDYEGREGIAITRDGWKLIEPLSERFTQGPELYRRRDDPSEETNVAADYEVRRGFLRSVARRYLMDRATFDAEEMPGFEHDTRRALEALGYLQ